MSQDTQSPVSTPAGTPGGAFSAPGMEQARAALRRLFHWSDDREAEAAALRRGREPSAADIREARSTDWSHTTPGGERVFVSGYYMVASELTRMSWTWGNVRFVTFVSGVPDTPDYTDVDAGRLPADALL